MKKGITRREFTSASFGVIIGIAGFPLLGQEVTKAVADLKPGEYTWHPERSPVGPLAIVVSLPDQLVHVYRAGIRIAVSTCSTGKEGHETPTGVFTILEKDRDHRSSTYNNAPMPNMNRLTWKGVALHAGNLPGYPASHGCVRLPVKFSALLFGETHVGTPVIIAGGHKYPVEVQHPGLVLSHTAETWATDAVAAIDRKPIPGENDTVTTVIASSADREVIVMDRGEIILRGKLGIDDAGFDGVPRLGEHVYVLEGANDESGHLVWHSVGYAHDGSPDTDIDELAELRHLTSDEALLKILHERLHPGSMLVLTDVSLHPDRMADDFVVMDGHVEKA